MGAIVHTVLMAVSTIGAGRRNRTRLNQSEVSDVNVKADKNTVVLGAGGDGPDTADEPKPAKTSAAKSSGS